MRQETEYQIMDFRIKQAELWREDVRDIIGLTSVKMDTYLIVNAVQLGFTVMAFCEGRLASGTPTWLVGCHTLSLAGAFMYLLMSVWFSMHASITAKSYETRLLTQLVRLPVPSWAQLEAARTYGSTFEKTKTAQMFRVPFAMGTQQRVLGEPSSSSTPALEDQQGSAGDAPASSADLWGLEGSGEEIYELDGKLRTDPASQRHLQLIKQVMHYWQSYDGFARVAMSMGTNQLILGLSYYVIGYVLISNKAIIACWLVVLLFMVIATALIRLDMSLTGFEFRAAMVLVFAGPTLTALAAQQWRLHTVKGYEMVHLLAPLPYAAEAAWLMLLLYISKVQEQEGGATLPTGFRSVMYIDVFGWIKRARAQKQAEEPLSPKETHRLPSPAEAAVPQPGRGPALEAVHYDGRILKGPAPRRPETLPGAAKPPPETLATKEMFDPTTFVPREKDGQHANHAEDIHPYLKPGVVPWRIFCSATTLLLVLWWISGVLILLQSSGWSALRVSPLLHDTEEGPAPIEQTHTAAFLLEEAAIQPHPVAESLHGEHIATFWPPGASPRHLSCASADGAVRFAASSRFGLFEATLNTGLKSNASRPSNSSAEFRFAPVCDDLEGEALQDLSVLCSGKDCHAQVLHRQGQRLASCSLGTATHAPEAVMSLGDTWLGQGDAARDEAQEEVSSLAMMDRCVGSSQRCAYAETTGGRLVELKSGLAQGSADWLPTRVLLADVGRAAMRKGAALHTLGDRYLAMLVTGGQELRIFDLRQSGKLLQRYPLPAQKQWRSMCSAGSNLFLLSEDPAEAAQIFRFPLPQSLLPPAQMKPKVLQEKAGAAPTSAPMTLASAYTQTLPKEPHLTDSANASEHKAVPWFAAKQVSLESHQAAANASAPVSKTSSESVKDASIAPAAETRATEALPSHKDNSSSAHAVPIFAAKRVSLEDEALAAAPSSKPSAAKGALRERRSVRKSAMAGKGVLSAHN
ncbi:unnamed protein product [Symbiodinium pilosum]|uniref:Uncharacterized protein n=1 Tax=Symbiodinium pilosum TaxID=2952 RepID=A0A812XE23_SYMPI|nr:unnamed protein product [Symbiodinium pilosum]